MQANYVQRLRIQFGKVGPTRFIGHLDVARTWERALNRAKVSIAYTQGFNRRPRMQFANALPLGLTSDCEYVDLWLTESAEVVQIQQKLIEKMAPGILIYSVEEVPLNQPSLPLLTREATFQAEIVHAPVTIAELKKSVEEFLTADEVTRTKKGRKNMGKEYNLRPLVYELRVEEGIFPTLIMRLKAQDEGQMGRPDEILDALGIDPLDARIHRLHLSLVTESAEIK